MTQPMSTISLSTDNPQTAVTLAQKQVQHMGLLLRVAREVAAHDNLEDMLRNIVAISAEETGAERGTLFMNDETSGELYSRIVQNSSQGAQVREIRILNNSGIAGQVFGSGIACIENDPYANPHFNRSVDQETGFLTRSLLCVPIRTVKGEVIGVLQMLNKKQGQFTQEDLHLLEEMTSLTAMTLRNRHFMERMQFVHQQERKFLDLVADVTSDIDLGTMLVKVVSEAARMLQADRATLFLNDEKSNELFSRVAMGSGMGEIRLPNHMGIAGAVFTSGQTINIPYAYADLRFNPAFDKKTGYFTRSILCVPIINKSGKTIGVTQVLNRKGGPFTAEDEIHLKAFTAQLAISLESAKLFDQVQQVKNYNESMLQSMSNGVLTLNENGIIVTCNAAGLRILHVQPEQILQQSAESFFADNNEWILQRIRSVEQNLQSDHIVDAQLQRGGESLAVNLTIQPLLSVEEGGARKHIGVMLLLEDLSSEKRMKSTMARYMDPRLAEQLMSGGEEVLGGKSALVTVLFSDIRNFTSISEELGAHATVSLLNEYFTIMVDCIQRQNGMLDKFIGDAIMASFGLPLAREDDADRAVKSAIEMLVHLRMWNSKRLSLGLRTVDIGIGLNTDHVVSGNIGSPKRMDYTIIGDGVNLASRLESACKQYGTRILISDSTLRALKGTYRTREIDLVVVKGKSAPVAVHEVLDYHNEESFPNLVEVLGLYKDGLQYYRKQQWQKAIPSLQQALQLNPQDKPTEIYLQRSQYMQDNPPQEDWDGVWVLKDK